MMKERCEQNCGKCDSINKTFIMVKIQLNQYNLGKMHFKKALKRQKRNNNV